MEAKFVVLYNVLYKVHGVLIALKGLYQVSSRNLLNINFCGLNLYSQSLKFILHSIMSPCIHCTLQYLHGDLKCCTIY